MRDANGRSRPGIAARQRQRELGRAVRAAAASIRRGERPRVDARIIEQAEAYLENRARYDERRARVRALAADVRAGKRVRVPDELRQAVERHLAYRAQYNDDRAQARRASRKPVGRQKHGSA